MTKHLPLIAFLTPLILFFAVPALFTYEQTIISESGESKTVIMASEYTAMIAARVVLMAIAIGLFWQFYLRAFPLRFDHWGVITGLVGGALWIALCHLQLEATLIKLIGLPPELLGTRDGINPYEIYPESDQRWLFLGFRFALLVITVPIAEELFLRGFFMRMIDAVDWTALPLGEIGTSGLVAGTLYGMATHPSEFIAAAAWFSLITLLMVKTGKFWNCVVAHAVTNLTLGIYIMTTGTWSLW